MMLTEFLLARIAEDEANAQRKAGIALAINSPEHPVQPSGLKAFSPFRVLTECEAKRRIVERCAAVDYAMPSTHLAHGILATLALPYADHPEYREEWKP